MLRSTFYLLLATTSLYAQTIEIENGARLEYKDAFWTFYEAQTNVPTRFKRFEEDGHYLWIFNEDGKVGLMNKAGKLILGTEYTRYRAFGEGKAWVEKKTTKGMEWQTIDSTGKVLYAFPFVDAQPFAQRLAWVLVKTLSNGDRWGLMGDDGYEKYPPIFAQIGARRQNLQLVAEQVSTDAQQRPILRWGWVNLSVPELAAKPIYERIDFVSDSLLALMTNNRKWMLMDIQMQRRCMPIYQFIAPLNDSLVKVNMGGKYDENGAVRGGVWGLLDHSGIVRGEIAYEELWAAGAGLFWVRREGHWGALDGNGRIILPFWYDAVTAFGCGRAWVKKEKDLLLIDEQGNEIARLNAKFQATPFANDRAWVLTDKEAWLVNTQGETLQKFKTTHATAFSEGSAWLWQEGLYGLVGSDGQWIKPPFTDKIPDEMGFPARLEMHQSVFQVGANGKMRD